MSEEQGSAAHQKLELRVSPDTGEVAYLYLPAHPRQGGAKTAKSVRLLEVLGPYTGPDIYLDFDQNDVLVGIEILL